jgi:hypothetical protein
MPEVTREQLVDALQEFHLWITPERGQTTEATGLLGTVQNPGATADGLLLALRSNAAHQPDEDQVDAHVCCEHAGTDPELAAMAGIVRLAEAGTLDGHAVVRALYPLDGPALVRVLRWLLARFPADED